MDVDLLPSRWVVAGLLLIALAAAGTYLALARGLNVLNAERLRGLTGWTLVGWLLLVALSGAAYLVKTLAIEPPSSDVYANTVGFQLAMFALFWMPWLIALLAAIVVAALVVERLRNRRDASGPSA